jgi:hydrogenase maturation protease
MPSNLSAKTRLVVIGFGNELRGDDAVGQHVARRVAAWGVPGVRALAVHQLTPELASVLGEASLAIFVDASLDQIGGEVTIRVLHPLAAGGALGHANGPPWLLAMTEALYHRCPRAWLIEVPAVNLDLSDGLSRTASAGMEKALERIAALVSAQGLSSAT